jgi:hypothetical protein
VLLRLRLCACRVVPGGLPRRFHVRRRLPQVLRARLLRNLVELRRRLAVLRLAIILRPRAWGFG